MRLQLGVHRRNDQRGQSLVEFSLLAPIMIFILFAMLDLARVFTHMASVESAAREAADYSTSNGAERWSDTNIASTVAEMNRRACVAASDLHDFDWSDTDSDGVFDDGESCTNPTFAYCVTQAPGGTCDFPIDATAPGYTCDDPDRDPPCTITVTMSHVFHLFVPFQLDFFGVTLGLPVTLPFQRDSTFAMTDIDVSPSPTP